MGAYQLSCGREERKQVIREKYARLQPHLGERGARLWAANEALSFGKTILPGKRELQAPTPRRDSDLVGGRQPRPGGSRKSILEKHPQWLAVIEQMVDPATRGDPLKPLRWVSQVCLTWWAN
jgi:hypothetical protein